jgi:glycosidase
MDFRVSRDARDEYRFDEGLFSVHGDAVFADPLAARRFAQRMVAAGGSRPDRPIQAGDIDAMGLIHEVQHLAVARSAARLGDRPFADVLESLATTLQPDRLDETLGLFEHTFPSQPVYSGDITAREHLDADTDGIPNREASLEELLLLWVANQNPAFMGYQELFDDRTLEATSDYDTVVERLRQAFARRGQSDPGGEDLVERLLTPGRVAPGSLTEQLRWIRDNWPDVVGSDLMARLTLTLDVLQEEEEAARRRWFGGAGDGGGDGGGATFGGFARTGEEPEGFSQDRDWMPEVVLMAKSTYVWLDQLSRRYGREIRTLDAIPDEELDMLARRGISGLWLIGLWERSAASERIKRWRGNADAVASAYSLDDYKIAADLGGDQAHANLRDRAAARGIRLASDMVPNHMGIDSRWVIDHPDRFLSVPEPPFPAYTFEGANLAEDDRVEIRLEDHYWSDSDAAVVFERRDRATGDVRYVYHGNDGTSFPWNDTAQLDYLQASVREAVIQTILEVARRFPVIRFDAAMVLAKRHIQRLWWPEPGHAGGIPSRSAFAMSKAAFDAAMPNEFWREVVDRVAAEAPDTLLLAEAFWMMEGYFVRTLGMHRVYNSAFMHLLRDEDNAGYRKVIRDTLEFDPEILKRYVNFLTNPDEETAVEQFGTGDKYFGVATLLATMPGLPMIGHGQIEGFGEKYGMEFRRARLDEQPNEGLVARWEADIVPLLHERWRYAEAADFRVYDVMTDGGDVAEDVFAYSNGRGAERSLVVYHNKFGSTSGWIRESVPFAVKAADGQKSLTSSTIAEALEVAGGGTGAGSHLAFREARSGLEFLRPIDEVRSRGLFVELDAYRCLVFGGFRVVGDSADAPWSRLAASIAGRGVSSLDEALSELRLAPVHAAVAALLAPGLEPADVESRRDDLLEIVGGPPDRPAERRSATRLPDGLDPAVRAAALLRPIDRATFDRYRLDIALRQAGLTDEDVRRTRIAVELAHPVDIGSPARLAAAWLADPEVRSFLGVNEWEGAEWFNKEALTDLLALAAGLDRARGVRRPSPVIGRLRRAAEKAGYRVDAFLAELEAAPASTATTPATTARARRPSSPRDDKPDEPDKP